MKVKTWIKYEVSYVPPRCRKPRYEEREEYIDLILKEISQADLRLAFRDDSYDGEGEIFDYKGKLWTKAKLRNRSWAEEHGFQDPLEELLWNNEHCSTYFLFHWDREERGKDTSRNAAICMARTHLRNYLLVDGVLFNCVSEPRYCIYTFGLGHNHGGTALSVDYHYNPNISKECYFSALQGEEAVKEAKRIALGRGDTESVKRFKPSITVFMPELVKVKPKKQHGNGNKMLNTLEQIVSASPNSFTAGLLCIAAVTDRR